MKIAKKVILPFGIIIMSIFIGCNSTKDITPVKNDVYNDSVDSGSNEESESDEASSIQATNQNKKNSNSNSSGGFNISNALSNFFSSKFIEYDNTTLFTPGAFGGIKQQNAITVIYPKTKEVGFGSPIMAAYYYLTFDVDGRKKIEKAVNQYLSDFENKKLDRKSKKSFKIYGSIKSNIYWGTVKNSTPNNTEGSVYLGYKFEGNSPYFTLFMYPTLNKMYTGADCNYPEKSLSLTYYFTKAQAQSLVKALSDDKIAEAFYDYEMNAFGVPDTADEYFDDNDVNKDELTDNAGDDSVVVSDTSAESHAEENIIADAVEE